MTRQLKIDVAAFVGGLVFVMIMTILADSQLVRFLDIAGSLWRALIAGSVVAFVIAFPILAYGRTMAEVVIAVGIAVLGSVGAMWVIASYDSAVRHLNIEQWPLGVVFLGMLGLPGVLLAIIAARVVSARRNA